MGIIDKIFTIFSRRKLNASELKYLNIVSYLNNPVATLLKYPLPFYFKYAKCNQSVSWLDFEKIFIDNPFRIRLMLVCIVLRLSAAYVSFIEDYIGNKWCIECIPNAIDNWVIDGCSNIEKQEILRLVSLASEYLDNFQIDNTLASEIELDVRFFREIIKDQMRLATFIVSGGIEHEYCSNLVFGLFTLTERFAGDKFLGLVISAFENRVCFCNYMDAI